MAGTGGHGRGPRAACRGLRGAAGAGVGGGAAVVLLGRAATRGRAAVGRGGDVSAGIFGAGDSVQRPRFRGFLAAAVGDQGERRARACGGDRGVSERDATAGAGRTLQLRRRGGVLGGALPDGAARAVPAAGLSQFPLVGAARRAGAALFSADLPGQRRADFGDRVRRPVGRARLGRTGARSHGLRGVCDRAWRGDDRGVADRAVVAGAARRGEGRRKKEEGRRKK